MTRLAALLLALLAVACEPPPADDAAASDGGVATIQQAVTGLPPPRCGQLGQPPCVYRWPIQVHFRWHFTYEPNADNDIKRFGPGNSKTLPRASPQRFGSGEAWFGGQPSIGEISPLPKVHYILNNCASVYSQDCALLESGDSLAGEVSIGVSGPFGSSSMSGMSYRFDSAPVQVYAGIIWLTTMPVCKLTGQVGGSAATEQRVYNIVKDQQHLYIDIETGSPYYEPAWWEKVSRACGAGIGIFNRNGDWHDEYWGIGCPGGGFGACYYDLRYDPDFHWH